MAGKFFTTKIQRVIGQLRFRPTLATYQAAPIIARKLESRFEHWNIKKYYNVTLYSDSEKKLLEVNYDSITYSNESEYNAKELLSYITELYKIYIESYEIVEIRRIGFRHTQILTSSLNFDDIVDLVYRKFYSPRQEIKKISADRQKDVVFVLEGVKNGFANRVQIGPLKKMKL